MTDLQPDGVGAQALALQQRREKLAKLGYFAAARKRPVPAMPKKIGIVTSRSGAALHDMLQILERRYPLGNACIYPALVQGDEAPRSIAEALHAAGNDGCDVILMGRGGGSNEDLSAFQSEEVAEAVFRSPVPVISAVGHETDHCIADEVADLRAPTPSAAAELAVPELSVLKAAVSAERDRLDRAFAAVLEQKSAALQSVQMRLKQQNPTFAIEMQQNRLSALRLRLDHAAEKQLDAKEQMLALLLSRMETVSPVAVLQRGDALVYRGEALSREAESLRQGDMLRIRLANGTVCAAVTEYPTDGS